MSHSSLLPLLLPILFVWPLQATEGEETHKSLLAVINAAGGGGGGDMGKWPLVFFLRLRYRGAREVLKGMEEERQLAKFPIACNVETEEERRERGNCQYLAPRGRE